MLNVSVQPGAPVGTTSVTVNSGLEMFTLPDGLTVTAASPQQLTLRAPALNAVTRLAGVPAGGSVLLYNSVLPEKLDGWSAVIGGLPTIFARDDKGAVMVQIPANMGAGPRILELYPPADAKLPVLRLAVQIDTAPPRIQSASAYTKDGPVTITPQRAAQSGDSITLTVGNLSGIAGVLPPAGTVWLSLNGAIYPAAAVTLPAAEVVPEGTEAPPVKNIALVQFVVPGGFVGDATLEHPILPVMVGVGTRVSAVYAMDVVPAPVP